MTPAAAETLPFAVEAVLPPSVNRMRELDSPLPLPVSLSAEPVPAAHTARGEPTFASPASVGNIFFVAGSGDDLSSSLCQALQARGKTCCLVDVLHDVEQNFLVEELFDAMVAKLPTFCAVLAVPPYSTFDTPHSVAIKKPARSLMPPGI